MFPVSGVESVFLPVTNNQTGNFYVMSGNAAGFSGLFVNNNVQPYPHEQQVHIVVFLSKMYGYLK